MERPEPVIFSAKLVSLSAKPSDMGGIPVYSFKIDACIEKEDLKHLDLLMRQAYIQVALAPTQAVMPMGSDEVAP